MKITVHLSEGPATISTPDNMTAAQMGDWLRENIPRIVLHPETSDYVRGVLTELNYGYLFESVSFAT